MKTIFITGASSGLGKATAKLFHNQGWNVIATMRNPEKETELSGLKNVTLLPLDVTNYDQIRFEWCIPQKSTLSYILANPHEFDKSYVKMLRDFCNDKIDKIEDYIINGKIQ